MAPRSRTARPARGMSTGKRRVNSDREERVSWFETFEDGNALRVEEVFAREPAPARTRSRSAARAHARTASRSRARAGHMSARYVLALSLVCVATLFLCVHYLELRSQCIHQSEEIAVMESQLSRLKADNDAYEKKAQASLNMEEIKETALNKLGLHYATESQIRYYNADNESYVRQYGAVPEG